MNRDWLLVPAVIVISVMLALGLLRWLAPGLLGAPADLQLVQLGERVPAFYRGVFQDEHFGGGEYLLKDPLTRIRARPLFPRFKNLGPNDILGFRNSGIPVAADIITIGDSMTYGNNAVLENNWPSVLHAALGRDDVRLYSMATGGWAAVQYLDMLENAVAFQPRVVVIAFYSGNDPLESFQMVYGNEHWAQLIPDPALGPGDVPALPASTPEAEQWTASFADGVQTVFTPALRLASNLEHPAVRAGYAIMADVARRAGMLAQQHGFRLLFTIIPTKELVYAPRVDREQLDAPQDYRALVEAEQRNIAQLADQLRAVPGAGYTDVVAALQAAALEAQPLYPDTLNGHPLAAGYAVIGEALAADTGVLLPAPPLGLYALVDADEYQLLLVNREGVWYFNSFEDVEHNGWPAGVLPEIGLRDIVNLPHRGVVTAIDPERFGPACCMP